MCCARTGAHANFGRGQNSIMMDSLSIEATLITPSWLLELREHVGLTIQQLLPEKTPNSCQENSIVRTASCLQ